MPDVVLPQWGRLTRRLDPAALAGLVEVMRVGGSARAVWQFYTDDKSNPVEVKVEKFDSEDIRLRLNQVVGRLSLEIAEVTGAHMGHYELVVAVTIAGLPVANSTIDR